MHIRHPYKTSYSIEQDSIDWHIREVSEEKDLGVTKTISDDLGVSRQCNETASKASRILGMVNRQFKQLDNKGF